MNDAIYFVTFLNGNKTRDINAKKKSIDFLSELYITTYAM